MLSALFANFLPHFLSALPYFVSCVNPSSEVSFCKCKFCFGSPVLKLVSDSYSASRCLKMSEIFKFVQTSDRSFNHVTSDAKTRKLATELSECGQNLGTTRGTILCTRQKNLWCPKHCTSLADASWHRKVENFFSNGGFSPPPHAGTLHVT